MTMKVFDNPQPPQRAQLALILLGSLIDYQEVDSQQPYIASSKFFVTSQGLKIFFGPSGVITPLYIHNTPDIRLINYSGYECSLLTNSIILID